ncbi:MAG TPA: cupin domain-containing protein [Edaphobacter sp.]|jgi:mannose-6-phosphate isomerase-like protein (cupin superfamily)|nr:cupin domain-containing protein [Edaphobacter sp.]
MPAKIIDTTTAEHYTWGGPNNNDGDGWYLVKTPDLHIIEEGLPPGVAEAPHHHTRSRQFFFVLSGQLTITIEHHDFVLNPGQGIEVSPGQIHQPSNRGTAPLRIIVTSQPPSHGDRIDD